MGADEIFVPGRLCLFGEHSDWAGGWRLRDPRIQPGRCLAAGTDQGLRARFAARDVPATGANKCRRKATLVQEHQDLPVGT